MRQYPAKSEFWLELSKILVIMSSFSRFSGKNDWCNFGENQTRMFRCPKTTLKSEFLPNRSCILKYSLYVSILSPGCRSLSKPNDMPNEILLTVPWRLKKVFDLCIFQIITFMGLSWVWELWGRFASWGGVQELQNKRRFRLSGFSRFLFCQRWGGHFW